MPIPAGLLQAGLSEIAESANGPFAMLLRRLGSNGGGPGSIGSGNTILWKPAGGGDATTFTQVYAFVQASKDPVQIWVERDNADPPFFVPPGDYFMHWSWFESTMLGANDVNIVDCADGVTFHNLFKIKNAMQLAGRNTGGRALLINTPFSGGSPPIYMAEFTAQYTNLGDAASPLVRVPASGGGGPDAVLAVLDGGGYKVGNPAASMLGLDPNAVGLIGVTAGFANLDNSVVSGDPSTRLIIAHDGVMFPIDPAGLLPDFTGTLENIALGQEGGSGDTAHRPTNMPPGCMYFDETLGIPVFVNRTLGPPPGTWVDSTGAPA